MASKRSEKKTDEEEATTAAAAEEEEVGKLCCHNEMKIKYSAASPQVIESQKTNQPASRSSYESKWLQQQQQQMYTNYYMLCRKKQRCQALKSIFRDYMQRCHNQQRCHFLMLHGVCGKKKLTATTRQQAEIAFSFNCAIVIA